MTQTTNILVPGTNAYTVTVGTGLRHSLAQQLGDDVRKVLIVH